MRPDVTAARDLILEALELQEHKALQKTIRKARKPYKGSLADTWFQEAGAVAKLREAASRLERLASAKNFVPKKTLATDRTLARQTRESVRDGRLKKLVIDYSERIEALARGSGQ